MDSIPQALHPDFSDSCSGHGESTLAPSAPQLPDQEPSNDAESASMDNPIMHSNSIVDPPSYDDVMNNT